MISTVPSRVKNTIVPITPRGGDVMISEIMYNDDWRKAAKRLIDQGYELQRGSGRVIPAIFVRGDERLYLFRPILDGEYEYRVGEHWMSDFSDKPPVIYHPKGAQISPRQTVWVPRRYDSLPPTFTVRDAAEHLGVTPAGVKAAYYQKGAEGEQRLVADTRHTGRFVLFSEANLVAWQNSRRVPRKSDRYRDRDYLESLPTARLRKMIITEVARGQLDAERVASAIAKADNRYTKDGLLDYLPIELDSFRVALKPLSKSVLVDILAE